ncbi:MAG: nitrite/sulfite reductase [Candidatus Methylomirabilales bacterium]
MSPHVQAEASSRVHAQTPAVPAEPTAPSSWSDPAEVEAFAEALQRFRQGAMTPDEFKRLRLQHGVYGQRQEELYMLRVRIPWGGLTAAQLAGLAEVARETSTGVGHVTTRQNIQLYSVAPDRVPEALRRLAAVGLTTREACGNTVRNVVACAHAGVALHEPFDVTPYAEAAARFFLRNPMSQALPRKFKISFSGCSDQCGLALAQDIGAVAAVDEAGRTRRPGFRLYVGGGLGASPEIAQLLEPFTPAEELLVTLAAIVRVFDRTGNRENRKLARLKFVVRRLGIAAFRELVEEERLTLRPAIMGDLPPVPAVVDGPRYPPGGQDHLPLDPPEFRRWHATNVQAQKQAGYAVVTVRLPFGDVSAEALRLLSFASAEFANGQARTTNQQNVLLRWVPTDRLPGLFRVLRAAGLARPGAERLVDVMACAGRDTCQVGITSSRGLGAAIARLVEERFADLADEPGLRVRISGCPNSCGHHHLASIGFSGGAREFDGQPVPTYQAYVGAALRSGATRYAQPLIKVPARNAPALVGRLLELYRRERVDGESFESVVDRLGVPALRDAVADLAALPPEAEAPEAYRDWNAEEAFRVQTGEGECGS